ncbi:MAG: hypothetical protein HY851_03075, partial [candidate division Zixibacteria bacterium]|nr:hypothetical protein [candidate division Zixibacteria bacterium]
MGNPLITLVSEDDWRRGLVDPAFFSRRILGVELHEGQEAWLNRSWMP